MHGEYLKRSVMHLHPVKPFAEFRIVLRLFAGLMLCWMLASAVDADSITSQNTGDKRAAQYMPRTTDDGGIRRRSSSVFTDEAQQAGTKRQESAFSCAGRRPDHYGDAKFDCTVYHVCDTRGGKRTYNCPEGTRFDQVKKICDYMHHAECGDHLADLTVAGSHHPRSTIISEPRTRRRNKGGSQQQPEPAKTDVKVLEAVRLMGQLTPTNHKNNPAPTQQSPQQTSPSEKTISSRSDYAPPAGNNQRRSFYPPAQARSPAIYNYGASQPGAGKAPRNSFTEEIDFPEDFYDEFVPKRETDVPDVQEFVGPKNYLVDDAPAHKQWPSPQKPHPHRNSKNHDRNRFVHNNAADDEDSNNNRNQDRDNSFEDGNGRKPPKRVPVQTSSAAPYPIGFIHPTQTAFRPIHRPAGVLDEVERSTTAAPQKIQAKFTLSDARGSSPPLETPNYSRNEPKDEVAHQVNQEPIFYPVIKPGGAQGYQVPHEQRNQPLRPFKKLRVTRPIKNQPMRQQGGDDWVPEYTSKSPAELDSRVNSKEESAEDSADFFPVEKPPRRNGQHGQKRAHGLARNNHRGKNNGAPADPRRDYKNDASDNASRDFEELETNLDLGPSSSPRSFVSSPKPNEGAYESHRIRQRHRQKPVEIQSDGVTPPRRKNSNKGHRRKRPRPRPALEWVQEDSREEEPSNFDSQEDGQDPEYVEKVPDKTPDRSKVVTPSLPAFEFNFGFKSAEFEDHDFPTFDENEEGEQSPTPSPKKRKRPLRKPHREHISQEPPAPVSKRPAVISTTAKAFVPSIEIPQLPSLVPDIQYVSFLPPPSKQKEDFRKESVSHAYGKQGLNNKPTFLQPEKSLYGSSPKPPLISNYNLVSPENPSNAFEEEHGAPLKPTTHQVHSNKNVHTQEGTRGWPAEPKRPIFIEPTPPTVNKPALEDFKPEFPAPASRQRIRNRLPGSHKEVKAPFSPEALLPSYGLTSTTSPQSALTEPPAPKGTTEVTTSTARPSRLSAYERYKNLREKYLAKFKSKNHGDDKTGSGAGAESDSEEEKSVSEGAAEGEEEKLLEQPQPKEAPKQQAATTESPVSPEGEAVSEQPKATTTTRGRFQPSRGLLRNSWKPAGAKTDSPVTRSTDPTPVYTKTSSSGRRPVSARERLQGLYRRRPPVASSTEKPEDASEPEAQPDSASEAKTQEVKIESIDVGGPLDNGALESPAPGNEEVKGRSESSDSEPESDQDEDEAASEPPHLPADSEVKNSAHQQQPTAAVDSSTDSAEIDTQRESTAHEDVPYEKVDREDAAGDSDDEEDDEADEDDPGREQDPLGATSEEPDRTTGPPPSIPFPSFASQEPVLPLQNLFSVELTK